MNRVQRLLVISILVAGVAIVFAAVRLATLDGGTSTDPEAPVVVEEDGEPVADTGGRVVAGTVELVFGVPKPRPLDLQARVGDRIYITVRSRGAEDTVLVHGYELRERVRPDEPARLRFRAEREGVYDVVLETSGAKIADLEVAP